MVKMLDAIKMCFLAALVLFVAFVVVTLTLGPENIASKLLIALVVILVIITLLYLLIVSPILSLLKRKK